MTTAQSSAVRPPRPHPKQVTDTLTDCLDFHPNVSQLLAGAHVLMSRMLAARDSGQLPTVHSKMIRHEHKSQLATVFSRSDASANIQRGGTASSDEGCLSLH